MVSVANIIAVKYGEGTHTSAPQSSNFLHPSHSKTRATLEYQDEEAIPHVAGSGRSGILTSGVCFPGADRQVALVGAQAYLA